MIMVKFGSLIDPKKKAEILQRIKDGKEPLCAMKLAPEPPMAAVAANISTDKKLKLNMELHDAVVNGTHQQVIDLLAKGADPNSIIGDNDGWTPLMRAAHTEKRLDNTIMLLIKAGASLESHDYDGWTPLFLAFERNNFNTAKVLMAAGADVNAHLIDSGITVLMYAVKHYPHDVVVAIVSYGADINAKDKNGKTALNHALDLGDTENADYLRSKGAVLG